MNPKIKEIVDRINNNEGIINDSDIDIDKIIGIGITNIDATVVLLKDYIYNLHCIYIAEFDNKIHIPNVNLGLMFGTNINKFNATNSTKIVDVVYIKPKEK